MSSLPHARHLPPRSLSSVSFRAHQDFFLWAFQPRESQYFLPHVLEQNLFLVVMGESH